MTDPVPLPPLVPVSPSTPAPRRWGDAVLAALVLAFAFFAASFAARNSDLWLHLATGRALAQGAYTFGVDPFSYTTEGVYWANHAWLFDLALFTGFSSLGGAAVVAIKAGLVAVLAGIMLRIGRQNGPFWVTAGCTLLALLAMSPRLLLQPFCVSLLLLAICLLLLRERGRALWALPAVVALWVNLDSWFWLGPLTVALFGIGERLSPVPHRLPLWLLPACLAACLVSPHHFHALELPAEVSVAVWRSGLSHDPRFAPLFAPPWQLGSGINLSAWAYFVLLLLGVMSFALHRPALRGWRSLVWLAFAALGAWQARLVPFFAVVAGPITALNLLSLLDDKTGKQREVAPRRVPLLVSLSPPLLVSFVALALLALAWPGWLQGFYRNDRGVAWEVPVNPSLQRVAGTLKQWRQTGELPSEVRTFALHPDVAHYLAWFCPGEKTFFDSRLLLFLPVVADYEQICLAFLPDRDGGGSSSGWQKTLRERDIACLILYDPDLRRLAPALRQLTREPEHWEPLRVDGQAVLVAWKEAPVGPAPSLKFNAERAAFTSAYDDALPPAPAEGPAVLAEPRPWWQHYFDRPSGSSWETEAATVYMLLFQDGAALQRQEQQLPVLARHAASLAGLPALPGSGPSCAVALTTRLRFEELFLPDFSERPPALPLLAVRAARGAIAAHPDDAGAWLVLAQAYLALGRTTTEAAGHAQLVPLMHLRYIQTVAALMQAVTLQPDLAIAHDALALLFAERGYLDLALRHRDIYLNLVRRAGPLPGEDRPAFDERIEMAEQSVERLRTAVQDAENRYAVHAQPLASKPLERAHLALQQGLAGKALDDVLLRSHADLYGVEGIRLVLELLLQTGRAQGVRVLLDRRELRANPTGLGGFTLPAGHSWAYHFAAYDWFDLCQSAAAGHYDRASAALERLRHPMRISFDRGRALLQHQLPALVATELALGAAPIAALPRRIARLFRDHVVMQLDQNGLLLVEQADLDVVEGMLLLERGMAMPARAGFRGAVPLYRRAEQTARALPGQQLAQRYLQRLSASAP